MPGPPPKRSDQRRRGEKGQPVPLTKAPAGPVAAIPALGDDDLHPMAADWYASLARSGQSAFYEASDWELARVAARILSILMSSARPSSQLLAAWLQMSSTLLVAEGDRRRMRIELVRDGAVDADADAAKATITTLQKRFSG